ncbi:NADH-quinone oxidoreductase subunit N [Aquirufa sp. ROCK-SH2]
MFSSEILASLDSKLHLITDGLNAMIPELLICFWMVVCLFAELFLHGKSEKFATSWRYFVAQIGILLAFVLSIQRMELGVNAWASFRLFSINSGSNAMNTLILFFAFLILFINQLQQKRFQLEEKIGFFSILSGALFTCISAHWLSIYLSIELMSLGTYLLVGIRKDVEGTRASIPYVLFGLATSAILLYGISLVYGLTGTLSLSDATFTRGLSEANPFLVITALSMVGAGFLFKMSWAPFQPWSPDVLETLPASWMVWISTAPKMAIAWLGLRLIQVVPISMVEAISLLAIITLLVGNFGALLQTNTKRLLAYSSIAHGGFMAMVWIFPIAEAMQALWFYSLIYGLSTILVFYALDEREEIKYQKDDLSRWSGLSQSKPFWALFVLIGFVSLVGLPPAGTFLAKLTYFTLLWQKYQDSGIRLVMILLLVSVFTTAVSIFYYLKIPYRIYFKKSEENNIQSASENGSYLWLYAILSGIIILMFILPNMFLTIWK